MTIYIDLDDARASTSISEHLAPTIHGTQGSPITIDFAFHSAGTVRALGVADAPVIVMQLASANGGDPPRAIGTPATVIGTGTSTRYRCRIVADNAAIRADFSISAVPLVYDLQLRWREPGDSAPRRTQGFSASVDVARDLPNTSTPNPVAELTDPAMYVRNRAVLYAEAQTLTAPQQAQALANLGLSNTLSYSPGTIAVHPTPVPGVRTEQTLQDALSAMAADATLHTIRFVDDTGVSGARNATASAFSRDTVAIVGNATLGDVDLSAVTFGSVETDCSFGVLTLFGQSSADRSAMLVARSPITVVELHAPGTARNTSDTFAARQLYVRGAIHCDTTDLSGLAGIDANGQRHASHGRCLEVTSGSYIGALSVAGGNGAVGDVGDMSGSGGNGGYPGTITVGPLCSVDYAGGVLSIGGTGGTGTGGGADGASHAADASSSVSVHGSSYVSP